MKRITFTTLLATVFVLWLAMPAKAQEKAITIEQLFSLTRQNHPNLKVAGADVAIARQNTAVSRTAQLPSVDIGLQGYYLGNAIVLDKDFSHSTKLPMPHFGNSFSIEARWLIWKGSTVRNSIQLQSLREELMQLNYQTNEQAIKLLVLGYYLDVYKLRNSEKVYRQNIALAEQRLTNSKRLYQEGIVTRNDVVRGELQLSNLNLALQTLQNNHAILNKQLTVALGLPETVNIVPDENQLATAAAPVQDFQLAGKSHPALRLAQKSADAYTLSHKLIAAERLPALSFFTGNKLQRPLTTTTPAVDGYSNGWSAGLSLNFTLDALFKTPQKEKLNSLERAKAEARAAETAQGIETGINAAYIRYTEAILQKNTYAAQKNLAAENYRIMESKYNNQLAILLDLLDASNAKLEAELQYTNAEASILFSFYKLLKESGQL